MQIQIVKGIYRKQVPELATFFPVNCRPVAAQSGISSGMLTLSSGIRHVTGTNEDRGGYVWNGTHFRVLGTQLVRVEASGGVQVIGSIPGEGRVRFAESFDRLAINSGKKLFYYNGSSITEVTDPDLGDVLSVIWVDGYFMTTDGKFLVVTELNDPTSVDPLKYGSSEADPDPVVGLMEIRGEVYAINRYSIEAFYNQGGNGFPFARQRGAQIPAGCVGRNAFCAFQETFAFVGSARNQQVSVRLAGSAQAIPISPQELDDALAALTDDELAALEIEARNVDGRTELLVRLPTETWVYCFSTSQIFDSPVWYRLAGGDDASAPYPARNFTLANGKWWCGSDAALGYVDATITSQFGAPTGYVFATPALYNAGSGGIMHEIELVTFGGQSPLGAPPDALFLSWSDDGITFSQERAFALAGHADRRKRTVWRRLGKFQNWRIFRFRGVASAPCSFARLEARVEGLSNYRNG